MSKLPMGTRTLLWGVHCWFIHPFAVAIGWWKLYGFPKDWRLWLCFLVHDWGYWGQPYLDDGDGKLHPIAGASIVLRLTGNPHLSDWCLRHSRYCAEAIGATPSRLCAADKMATAVLPRWLYLFLARLSGELGYYIEHAYRTLPQSDPVWLASNSIVCLLEEKAPRPVIAIMEDAWVRVLQSLHAAYAYAFAADGPEGAAVAVVNQPSTKWEDKSSGA